MKMQAMQSAIAVRRQRSRWENKRTNQRKQSRDSLSTPRDSLVSIEGKVYFDKKRENKSMFGQVTMFHVGGVFILIGLMLVITALMPGYVKNSTQKRRNDILGTGSVFTFIGCILTTVSRFISNNEERELNEYIQSRLARSKSGHRLMRENSGLPTPGRERKFKPHLNGVSTSTLSSEASTVPMGSPSHRKKEHNGQHCNVPPSKPHKSPSNQSGSRETKIDINVPASPSDDAMLSKIIEEDEIDLDCRTECDMSSIDPLNSTPDLSLTSASPLEAQIMLEKNARRPSKGSSKGSFRSNNT